jgi:hypothetical protein
MGLIEDVVVGGGVDRPFARRADQVVMGIAFGLRLGV